MNPVIKPIILTMITALALISSQATALAQVDNRIAPTYPQPKTRIIPNRPPIFGPRLKVRVPKQIIMPPMIEVARGTFVMGAELSKQDDGPEHKVEIPAFEISKTPITNRQFNQFVETTGYKTEAERDPTPIEKKQHISWKKFATAKRNDYPVVWITYNDANAYCRWLSLLTQNKGSKVKVIDEAKVETKRSEAEVTGSVSVEVFQYFRLPLEAEWEFAARGDLARMPYPWGETAEKDRLNCNWDNRDDSIATAIKYLKPVGHQPVNSFGLHDMAGNVGQWCYDFYNIDFYANSPAFSPYGPDEGSERVVRGGSWFDTQQACRVSARQHQKASERNARTSFRIARSKPTEVRIIDENTKE